MKSNNRGMSLIELVVVIAIMTILIGAGGYGVVMLSGAEARQAAKMMEAQLNDIKTGSMSRAAEYMYLYYVDSSDLNADKGVDSVGFYVDKRISTIANTSTIMANLGDPEYSRIGSGKVKITAFYDSGSTYDLSMGTGNALLLEFDRKSGTLLPMRMGSAAGIDPSFYGSGTTGTLEKMTFECGVKTYTITFDTEVGTYSLE